MMIVGGTSLTDFFSTVAIEIMPTVLVVSLAKELANLFIKVIVASCLIYY